VPIVVGTRTRLVTGVRPDLRLVPSQATNSPIATHVTYQLDAPGKWVRRAFRRRGPHRRPGDGPARA
jgi:hypothetical protein